jgi:chromosome segregation ATPase
VGELDAQLQTVVRERAELQSTIDSTEKRIEDLSFCFTESEVQREDLEMRLNEIRSSQLQPLIEMDEPPQEKGNL